VAIGRRMPPWISDGFSEYAQRLRSGVQLELIEVDTPRRGLPKKNMNLTF